MNMQFNPIYDDENNEKRYNYVVPDSFHKQTMFSCFNFCTFFTNFEYICSSAECTNVFACTLLALQCALFDFS